MGAATSTERRRSSRKREGTPACGSLSVLLRRLVLCQGQRPRTTPRQKRPLVQRRSRKKADKPARKAALHASERVALTSRATVKPREESDTDSLTASSGPSVKLLLATQRQPVVTRDVSASPGCRMSATDEALGTADQPAGHAGPEVSSARLVDIDFVNVTGPDDGASSDGSRAHEAGTRYADADVFAAGTLPSFASVQRWNRADPPPPQLDPGLSLPRAPLQPLLAEGVMAGGHTCASGTERWEEQIQVAKGLGKYHAAMAAAREQVEAASHDVGRVGPATGRKFRRCVYDTELE